VDRKPRPAPFPVGTRLRCKSDRESYFLARDRSHIRTHGRGLEVTIVRVRPGRQGTLSQLRDDDGPMYYVDTGEPILDRTTDGVSVYEITDPPGKTHGRRIGHDTASDWEPVQ